MRLLTFYCIFFVASGLLGQPLYFPPLTGEEWERTEPASLGYCVEGVAALSDYLESSNTKAFILLQDGKIVMEEYFNDFGPDSLWLWNSAGKTVTATLVGIAQREGFLSLDDPVSDYLGDGWTSATPLQEGAISIRNLLSQTSGLDDKQGDFCTDPECLEYLADAGSRWAYHNGAYTQLTAVLPAATGIPLNQYLVSRLRNRVGMNGGFLSLGYNRVYASNARSMARFGLLMLNQGNWGSTSILGDTTYHRQMVNSSQDLNPAYGFLWWLNGKERLMVPQLRQVFNRALTPAAPVGTYVAMGKDGQLINVVPEKSLVWIRMGEAFQEGGAIAVDYNEEVWTRINDLGCTTSTNSSPVAAEIRLFPNPARDVISLRGNRPLRSASIYGARGTLLRTIPLAGNTENISTQDLPAGLYYLQILLRDGSQMRKKMILVR